MEQVNRILCKALSALPIIMVAIGIILLLLCGEVLERSWEIASSLGVLLIIGGIVCSGFNVIVKAAQKYLDKK